ncbi:hypothetical protein BDB01DRAFT_228922 [Pilobolus umbonatus]|nr:hypothetical protein BDB01DRAFT_228922 [Pilobolus umbonatus]
MTNRPTLYKTEYCKNWDEHGQCRYGNKCRYAHGVHDLRFIHRPEHYRTKICRAFHELGICDYGPRCKYIHESNSSKLARKLPTQPQAGTLHNIPKESPATLVHDIKTSTDSEPSEPTEGPDQTLLQHLSQLGPVTIEPTMTKMRTSDTMLGIINKRGQIQERELPPGLGVTDEYMSIDSLFTLLEQRKHLNPGDMDRPEIRQTMMDKYKINEPTLHTLFKYYNTIAIMPPIFDDKEERRVGVWVTDKADWELQVRKVDERNKALKKAKEEAIKDNKGKTDDIEKKKEESLKDLFDESY